MKKLYIVRHAKSSWDNPDWTDFERPLNKRGLRDAPFMANKFAREGHTIDQIISSPAKRAITTARYFAQSLQLKSDAFVEEPSVYGADLSTLLALLESLPHQLNNAMLFGHNPGLSMLASHLAGEYMQLSTCTIAAIEMHLDSWKHISKGCGRIIFLDYPKKYFS